MKVNGNIDLFDFPEAEEINDRNRPLIVMGSITTCICHLKFTLYHRHLFGLSSHLYLTRYVKLCGIDLRHDAISCARIANGTEISAHVCFTFMECDIPAVQNIDLSNAPGGFNIQDFNLV